MITASWIVSYNGIDKLLLVQTNYSEYWIQSVVGFSIISQEQANKLIKASPAKQMH